MADLDVSELLEDPDFCEPNGLQITRTTSTMGTNGRPNLVATTISPAPAGVVQPTEDGQTVRAPDMEYRPQRIRIWTTFRLSAPAPGQIPDKVTFGGDIYTVTVVKNWTHFGSGFVYAEAESVDATDQIPG